MKKGSTKRTNGTAKAIPAAPMRKSVDIKKANNGFVVSQWSDKGEKIFIAKTQKEAQAVAGKLLKI